jgi:hypothetical protein
MRNYSSVTILFYSPAAQMRPRGCRWAIGGAGQATPPRACARMPFGAGRVQTGKGEKPLPSLSPLTRGLSAVVVVYVA